MTPKQPPKKCLRCPEAEGTRAAEYHRDDLSKCLKEFPYTDPKPYDTSELWPTFDEGDNTLDLSNNEDCINLIKTACTEGPGVSFKNQKINKSMLEAAAERAYPAKARAKKPNKSTTAQKAVASSSSAQIPKVLPSRPAAVPAPSSLAAPMPVAAPMSAAGPMPAAAPMPVGAPLPAPAPAAMAPSSPAVPAASGAQVASAAVGPATAPIFTPAGTSNTVQDANAPTVTSSGASSVADGNSAPPLDISEVKYVNALADRVYLNSRQSRTVQMSATGGATSSEEQKRVEVRKICQKLGLRTTYASGGKPTKIVTNYLTLVPPKQIHVYSLEMIRNWDPLTNRAFLVKKQWDKLEIVNRVRDGQHLWRPHLHATQDSWVTDGDLIWSAVPLFGLDQANPGPLTLLNPVPPIQYHNETGSQLDVEQVEVTYQMTIVIQNTPVGALFYDTTAPTFNDSVPGILTRGLNAFLTRQVHRNVGTANGQYTLSGINRSFSNAVTRALNQGNQQTSLAMGGYFLSVRPGVEKLFININHATSPFFEPMLVSQFIARALGQHRSPAEIQMILKGVEVRIQYQTRNAFASEASRHRFIAEVSPNTICDQRPNMHNNQATDVHAWYNAQNSPYRMFPNFPTTQITSPRNTVAINIGKDAARYPGEEEWLPADQLMIVARQSFKGRLTGNETSTMIRVALRGPQDHHDDLVGAGTTRRGIQGIQRGLAHFGFDDQANAYQGFLGRVGISSGHQFLPLDARTLQAPALVYRRPNSQITMGAQIKDASWNLQGVKFATSPTSMQELLLLRIGNIDIPGDFGDVLWGQLVLHGVIQARTPKNIAYKTCHIPPGTASLSAAWETAISTGLTSFPSVQMHVTNQLAGGPQAPPVRGPIVLVLMDRHNYDHYACIKRVGDLQLGINTICVTADKLQGNGWNLQKASNLALKFNIKGSADTHTLQSPHLAALRHAGGRAAIANTLVVGADVAHPTKGCLNGTPSVSAVVGTVDDAFMQYRGSIRLQRGRKEEIGFLQEMIEERLDGWAAAHQNQLPINILFYRDGVSESQYEMVRTHEIPQIQNAVNEADRRLKGTNSTAPPAVPPPILPTITNRQQRVQAETTAYRQWADQVMTQPNNISCKITFVVVGKRHNTRFYPADGTPRVNNGNCLPGLAVDRVITHPSSMDFYLQSHLPIKGTGRSAHYFVTQNGMNLSIDQLQGITHTFCYASARATRGVSYCAPAYYADKLCDRGRAYIRHLLVGKTPHSLTLGMPPLPSRQVLGWAPRRQNQPWPNQPAFNPPETHEQYMNAMAHLAATDQNYFRGWWAVGQPPAAQHQLLGQERKLPWHRNLDTTMFWL